jgi:hypothetical protein
MFDYRVFFQTKLEKEIQNETNHSVWPCIRYGLSVACEYVVHVLLGYGRQEQRTNIAGAGKSSGRMRGASNVE